MRLYKALILLPLLACSSTPPDTVALCGADAGADAAQPDASEQRRIVAIIGPSNADGLGNSTLVPDYIDAYPAVTLKQRRAGGATNPIPWVDTSNAPLAPRCLGPNCFGVELSLGRALDAANPGLWSVTKLVIDGSGLNQHWRPGATYPSGGTPLHTQLMTWLAESEAELSGKLAAVVIIQGERDALYAATSAAFQADQEAQIAAIQAVYPDAIFLLNRLHAQTSPAYNSVVRAAQEAQTGVTLVDIDDLSLKGDLVHFTPATYITLGERFASAYLSP